MRIIDKSHFQNNPFFILEANPRDTKARLIELADDKLIELDSEICSKARSELTNPRLRIIHEISWFPGVSPKKAQDLLRHCLNNPKLVKEIDLPHMARINLWPIYFDAIDDKDNQIDISTALEVFANELDVLPIEDLLRDINEDRLVSGFPEISSIDVLEDPLNQLKKSYKLVVQDSLNRLSTDKLIAVIKDLVENTTNNGKQIAPELINTLLDGYELETHRFLTHEYEAIKKLKTEVLNNAENGFTLEPILSNLIKVVKNFNTTAKSLQLIYKSRGLQHDMSKDVAYTLRSLSVDLFNKYNLFETTEILSKLIRANFSDIAEIADRIDEDHQALVGIKADREKRKAEDAKRAADITYSTELGLLIKSTLKISPEGVYYDGKGMPLNEITKISWGSVSHRVNGIPTGTDYSISFGSPIKNINVSTRKKEAYDQFTSRLWKAVGFRLITDFMDQLKKGLSLSFGDFTVWDDRITLKKHKFIGSEPVTCFWSDVKTYSSNGSFFIVHKLDSKIYGSVSYQSNNTHVIVRLIELGFDKPGMKKLSQIFD